MVVKPQRARGWRRLATVRPCLPSRPTPAPVAHGSRPARKTSVRSCSILSSAWTTANLARQSLSLVRGSTRHRRKVASSSSARDECPCSPTIAAAAAATRLDRSRRAVRSSPVTSADAGAARSRRIAASFRRLRDVWPWDSCRVSAFDTSRSSQAVRAGERSCRQRPSARATLAGDIVEKSIQFVPTVTTRRGSVNRIAISRRKNGRWRRPRQF